jgi:hypothetical protein
MIKNVGLQIPAAVTVKITAFWHVKPCDLNADLLGKVHTSPTEHLLQPAAQTRLLFTCT